MLCGLFTVAVIFFLLGAVALVAAWLTEANGAAATWMGHDADSLYHNSAIFFVLSVMFKLKAHWLKGKLKAKMMWANMSGCGADCGCGASGSGCSGDCGTGGCGKGGCGEGCGCNAGGGCCGGSGCGEGGCGSGGCGGSGCGEGGCGCGPKA